MVSNFLYFNPYQIDGNNINLVNNYNFFSYSLADAENGNKKKKLTEIVCNFENSIINFT